MEGEVQPFFYDTFVNHHIQLAEGERKGEGEFENQSSPPVPPSPPALTHPFPISPPLLISYDLHTPRHPLPLCVQCHGDEIGKYIIKMVPLPLPPPPPLSFLPYRKREAKGHSYF